jgi:hypothetical protein
MFFGAEMLITAPRQALGPASLRFVSCVIAQVPFMDYIVGADGMATSGNEAGFVDLIGQHHQNKTPIALTIYSLLTGQQREVSVTPSSTWGGDGLLGLIIRADTMKGAEESCIHVLEVRRSIEGTDMSAP